MNLKKFVNDHQINKDRPLLAFRSSIHKTKRQALTSAVFKKELMLLADLMFRRLPDQLPTTEDYMQRLDWICLTYTELSKPRLSLRVAE